jgi:hypothetical protein
MLKPFDAIQDFLLEAQVANLRERELGELQRGFQTLCTPLVMDCELHAGVNACGVIGGKLVPDFGSLLVVAAPFCQQREFAARLPVVFPGQAEIDGLRAGGVRSLRIAAPL